MLSNVDSSSKVVIHFGQVQDLGPAEIDKLGNRDSRSAVPAIECIFLSLGQGDGAAESEPGCLQIDDAFSDGVLGRDTADRTLISKTALSSVSVLPQWMSYRQGSWIHLDASFYIPRLEESQHGFL
ncbi:hypothetical protein CGCS363_v002684 [Colletotrichum siamense]|uniref:uncharacterized protein n=1 Tax=Colletotrichum siamense TaxID=690259 RepID=UPI001872C376|nr:uncharacterized protein CGCS363_v002684 [Colletotrichum siamense]KAF5511481.1 hypothetical protein CGCS363_v002684 [Colletotrichum siamense]